METPSRTGAAIWAGSLALVVPAAGAGLLAVLFRPRTVVALVQEGGPWAWAVIGTAAVMAFAIAVLVALTTLGRRIPAALSLALAALPWLMGAAALRGQVNAVVEVIAVVTPDDRGRILAAGTGEALSARVLGAWLSSALFAGTALALLVAAKARRPENRSAIGLMFGIPAAVLVVPALLVTPVAGSRGTFGLALPAVAFTLVAALAGWYAGRQRGAAGSALPFAAAVAGALSFLSADTMLGTAALREALLSNSSADPAARGAAMAAGLTEYGALRSVWWMGVAVALLTCAMVLVWSFSRARPERMAPGGLAAVIVTALLVVGADRVALSGAMRDAANQQPAFAVELPRWPLGRVPLTEPLLMLDGPVDAAQVRAPVTTVAAGRDVGGAALRALIATATENNVERLRLATTTIDEELVSAMAAELEPLAPALFGISALEVSLLPGIGEDAADADPVLWHATLGVDEKVSPRAGTEYAAFPLEQPPPFKDGVVYLAISEHVTVQQVVRAAGLLQSAGFRTVLVTELPGHPERELAATERAP